MGRTVMAPVGIPRGSMIPASVPKARAWTRSVIPRTCQKMKPLRCAGLANRRAANGAVTPMAISPPSSGQGEELGQNLIGAEDEEHKAGDAHALHQCEGTRAQRQNELSESPRGCKPNQEQHNGRDH